MSTVQGFLQLPLVRSSIGTDERGNLVRIEYRKCDVTGTLLRGKFPMPHPNMGKHRNDNQDAEEKAA